MGQATLDLIYEEVKKTNALFADLVRTNKTDKMKLLEETTKRRGRIEVQEVRQILGISKPWALELMKQLSKEEHFKFVRADKKFARGSVVIYQEPNTTKDYCKNLLDFLEGKQETTFAEIRMHLKIPSEKGWLEKVKEICHIAIESGLKGYLAENRLIKSN